MSTLSQKEIKKLLDSNQIVISSWEDFHHQLGKMTDSGWIFRGVSSPEHYPLPSIGREKVFGPYKEAHETRLFDEFKKRAITLYPRGAFDDWHWLAYAQHLGIPTRLLDWSTSPLIAAFFAVEESNPNDRLIYCTKYSTFLHEVKGLKMSPFKNKSIGRYSPPLLFERLQAQRGVFTIHPDPTKIFYHKGMKVLRITNDRVKEFRKRLFKYGIDYWHIYPDGEGLGQQLRWQFKNKIGLGSIFMNEK